MGLSWQQGPLAPGAIGRFLTPGPLRARRAAWSYQDAWPEVGRVSGLVSFEPDKDEVRLDGARLRLEPSQTVVPHGVDRDLTTDEMDPRERR